jgi:hypothetical protein
MLVRDQPFAIDLAKTNGCPYPDVGVFSVRSFSRHVVNAMNEGNVAAGSDFQVTKLITDRTNESGKPFI